ncbi:MAG: FMN-binding glutamate synthase family protein [Myxococcota bacterium]
MRKLIHENHALLLWLIAAILLSLVGLVGMRWHSALYAYVVLVPIVIVGIHDALQSHHAVLRNFPVVGHFRYLFESIRPEINQYFVESDNDGVPFSREKRSIVYQRAKHALDTIPFGTKHDVYAVGYEWLNHSIGAKQASSELPRVMVGGDACKHPYNASLLNVSAMSFGSLSPNAILALNKGARLGNFSHNTGEGGLSPYHLRHGGDLVWQIGTGYFGARTAAGRFDPAKFAENAQRDSVKMIEIKPSQGAKPGHGGILPGRKVTAEIAAIRGVEMGKDVISPPAHSAFSTPIGLLEFIASLRDLSGGKPVGFKLCLGSGAEFFAICKAMLQTGILPDYITVDGGEGGTGAAPPEFSNSIGTPLTEGLVFVHDALVGCDLREKIRVIASGKVVSGFHVAYRIALGADMINSARSMMFALGCIQALRCNTNHCPVGIATQDPRLNKGLVVSDKALRVASYHRETLHGFNEVISAAGYHSPRQLRREDIHRRITGTEVCSYEEIFPTLQPGCFLGEQVPSRYASAWKAAQAQRFGV